MVKLSKTSFYLCTQAISASGKVQEIFGRHGEDTSFYSSGVGIFNMGDMAGR